jgi:hypothetical protein
MQGSNLLLPSLSSQAPFAQPYPLTPAWATISASHTKIEQEITAGWVPKPAICCLETDAGWRRQRDSASVPLQPPFPSALCLKVDASKRDSSTIGTLETYGRITSRRGARDGLMASSTRDPDIDRPLPYAWSTSGRGHAVVGRRPENENRAVRSVRNSVADTT